MLRTIRRIVQDVNAARDFSQALEILVHSIREAVDAKACSVFLMDADKQEYVLTATEGLNPEAVGKIRVPAHAGLVGFVGQREEPVNIENAQAHPNFLFVKEALEDNFRAFLGAPIIHHRKVLGVLVVQEEEERRFDESEEAFLVTMSAQLAGIIAHAQASGGFAGAAGFLPPDKTEEVTLGGIPGVPGVGIGTAVVVYPKADLDAVPDRAIQDVEAEIELFRQALSRAKQQMENLGERLATHLPEEERALFDAYVRILESESFIEEVVSEIKQGQWAQASLSKVIKSHVHAFEAMEDDYLQERAADLRDLGRRLLAELQACQPIVPLYPQATILIGDEVPASALAEVPEGYLVAVVSGSGSSNSHVAILARALGVPAVMGVGDMPLPTLENQPLIVDGYYGQVYVNPSVELLEEFTALAQEERELDADLVELRGLPAETPDGSEMTLYVNTGLAVDAANSLSVGAEGIGLFRSELPFMVRDSFPTEEEQRIIYRQLLQAFSPRPVTMRLLDVGGDKALPYFSVEEKNPVLGWRGIRMTLDHPEVFLVQARAMLRASEGYNNLRILIPMITSIGEVEESMHLLNKAYHEVVEEGATLQMPEVGVMIEVPSAVYLVKEIASRVDFISVGTNDLVQYILAVDRNNSRVASLYDSLHPAVLRALKVIADDAHGEKTPVSLCGEMASDPAAVVLLLAMGYDALSMNPTSLPRTKWVIRNITLERAKVLLKETLAMDNATLIRFHLEQALEELGLGGLVRAGR